MLTLTRRNIERLGLRPLTARSVVLSTLLGKHPPRLPARQLVRSAQLFDISGGTVRVALSRMLAEGDLVQVGGEYRLSDRLVRRQVRQDESRTVTTRPWGGEWEIVAVTKGRRTPAEREILRASMVALRLGELREGVWIRPNNLVREIPTDVTRHCSVFIGRPDREEPLKLTISLWDLKAWSTRAHRLLEAMSLAEDLATTCMVAAAVLRHLLADPFLPSELLPARWPGDDLRMGYDRLEARWQSTLDAHLQSGY